MTGDLADAVMFTSVQALEGHRFSLSTRSGLGNSWTTRQWMYDADTDTIGEPSDAIDESSSTAGRPAGENCGLAAESGNCNAAPW